MISRSSLLLFLTGILLTTGCRYDDAPEQTAAPKQAPAAETSAVDLWWNHLTALCGEAYPGSLASDDEADAALAEQTMTMHVRRCSEQRLEIPFHIGENRSRTWVLTRTEKGLRLQHDHRHEDGVEDTVTLYGGHTDPNVPGTEIVQYFPADDFSKKLFEDNALKASVANTWSMEIVPGERFSYVLRRPERHFRADFDLTRPVDPPPPPWGHDIDPAPGG